MANAICSIYGLATHRPQVSSLDMYKSIELLENESVSKPFRKVAVSKKILLFPKTSVGGKPQERLAWYLSCQRCTCTA